MALCGVIFSQNLVIFRKKAVAYFFVKIWMFFKKVCGTMWHYVALCGVIFSQNLVIFRKKGCGAIFFLRFECFSKKSVALCGAMWRYFFSKFGDFSKKGCGAIFLLRFEGFSKKSVALCGTMWRYVALFFLKIWWFFEKRLWRYFFVKIWMFFQKSLWHYVALCGAMWRYFFSKFGGFSKKSCGAIFF